MIKYDALNRIIYIDDVETIEVGHSVCNRCGKDMPKCWNVVCFGCSKTFCYKCTRAMTKHWICKSMICFLKWLIYG